MFVAIFSIILIIIDQFTKFLAASYLANEDSVVLIDNFLRLYYIENRGAAFGILQGFRFLFAVITVAVLIILIVFLIKNYNKVPFIYLLSFSLLIGGTIGNFIDRVRLHYVIDFISMRFFGYDFAIFNFADVFIVVGTILISIGILLHDNKRWFMYKNTFIVDKESVGLRLDKFLEENLEINRSQIKKNIVDGNILLNNNKVKAGYNLKLDDEITVEYEDDFSLSPEKIDFDVLYEDDYLAVISKPQDLVVHPGAGNKSGTLVNGLLYKFKELSNPIDHDRLGIVHRLDKDTSGLMLIAKKDEAYYKLVEMFKNRQIYKHYLAICHGNIYEDFDVKAPIGRDPNNRIKMRVIDKNSKEAYTSFKVLKNFDKYTLLDVHLHTGRTHQIRVHLAYVNHPVVGDEVYGIKNKFKISKQLLHAYKLKFNHPISGEELEIIDKFPVRFEDFINKFS